VPTAAAAQLFFFLLLNSAVCLPFPKPFQLSSNSRDYSALQQCLDDLPSLHELTTASKEQFENLNIKLTSQQRALLEWTLASHPRRKASAFQPISLLTFLKEVPCARLTGSHASNPSLLPHAVFKLSPQAQQNFSINEDNDNLNGGNPEFKKESTQQQQQRTITGFHGTSFENLHSIIRSGLVPASGTKLERNGKTFGEGIYLSTELPVAYTFCSGAERWKGSSLAPEGTRLRCILVCGVKENAQKDEGELVSKKDGGPPPEHYIVIDRPDLIKLQYILVYVDHCGSSNRNPAAGQGQNSGGGASLFSMALVVLMVFVLWLIMSENSSTRRFVY
jgi:Poly(ADP-ribose) polymerase catalytic domain